MSRRWVVNASPLILLGKIDQIPLLSKLADELIVPDAVAREVGARHEGELVLAEVVSFSNARLEVEVPISSELAAWDLGAGESQVIALASARSESRAVLDDLEARRCAGLYASDQLIEQALAHLGE
jgi:predicted nucleic acid-binding protein